MLKQKNVIVFENTSNTFKKTKQNRNKLGQWQQQTGTVEMLKENTW